MMEALRGSLLEHKENVEAGFSGGKIGYNELPGKARTPGTKQPYSTPKSVKVGGRSSSTTKKPRRALGDISNQHRNSVSSKNGVNVPSKSVQEKTTVKPKIKIAESALKKSGVKLVRATVDSSLSPTTPSRDVKTPKESAAALLCTTVGSNPSSTAPANEVEDIEFAYGGLPSHGLDPAYLMRIREEVVSELLDDKQPTIMDQYVVDEKSETKWESEIRMLASGEAPSPWWSRESPESFADTTTFVEEPEASSFDLSAVAPDECDHLLPEENDQLLDEILKVEIPVTIE